MQGTIHHAQSNSYSYSHTLATIKYDRTPINFVRNRTARTSRKPRPLEVSGTYKADSKLAGLCLVHRLFHSMMCPANHQLVASENLGLFCAGKYRPAHSSSPANSHSPLAWRALFILHSTALWA